MQITNKITTSQYSHLSKQKLLNNTGNNYGTAIWKANTEVEKVELGHESEFGIE